MLISIRAGQFVYLIVAAYIVLNPEYAKPTHRGARTRVFIFLGLSSVFPVMHTMVSHGLNKILRELGFSWLVASGALYIAGALI
jgi:adiponectin receptor